MRIVIQRVKSSRLEVNGELVSEIVEWYNVFVGVIREDTEDNMKKIAHRIASLRLFKDDDGKLKKNIKDVDGEVLLVSNFTLCDRKQATGTRPDFSLSADKEKAIALYEALQKELIEEYDIQTKMGRFAENMQIYTQIDGPLNLVQEY
ncbi:MAG: D-tyrosyl-tRNA(Tyr) deacylase [Clostridia bacterium]|nr:D-tyrosyl-tRNA(Tyr) deacylase [Clostridia bacterium]